ncbi:heat shock protein Hsp20 [Thiohalospira halophila DSM 15071]|uniref:Heat shock protein Hsp20 n=1 Tax=Thiohalospira halophila DSM 15071 TaxID=1123397 RepID=A0A1I1TD12_9GAMM|nr:Hsp20/alpha crystallin family protein [Thiohalospira halophila]SFD55028.1 heat shock protein Hsp20 [Thiohalospira halophila DSM 15071]
MNMVRYRPWNSLEQMRQEMDRLFEDMNEREESGGLVASDWVPAVDIRDEANQWLIHADIPGVKPEDIEVGMENGVLTIKGERKEEKTEGEGEYKRTERIRGSFFRRFTLPDTADAENIRARCDNGVLEVNIPKQAKSQPRRITVES